MNIQLQNLFQSKIFQEGKWKWLSNRYPFESYQNWCKNEPSQEYEGSKEDFLSLDLRLSDGPCWNDVPLNRYTDQKALCQLK